MKIDRAFIIQFIKFSLVGVLNVVIDWGVFFLLTYFIAFFTIQTNEVYAKIIAFVCAVTNSFIFNSLWTFRQEFQEGMKNHTGEKITKGTIYFTKFLTVSLIGLAFNAGLFLIIRPWAGNLFSERFWAQLFTLVIVTATVVFWNFLANKFWTYKIENKK